MTALAQMGTWQPIETAPKDGTRFYARHFVDENPLNWLRRVTWWGKASHIPLYGWCWGEDVEDIDLWSPTQWLLSSAPPASREVEA